MLENLKSLVIIFIQESDRKVRSDTHSNLSVKAHKAFLDAATHLYKRVCPSIGLSIHWSDRAMFVKTVEICSLKWSERCESPGKGKQQPILPLPNGSRICWSCIRPCSIRLCWYMNGRNIVPIVIEWYKYHQTKISGKHLIGKLPKSAILLSVLLHEVESS